MLIFIGYIHTILQKKKNRNKIHFYITIIIFRSFNNL